MASNFYLPIFEIFNYQTRKTRTNRNNFYYFTIRLYKKNVYIFLIIIKNDY